MFKPTGYLCHFKISIKHWFVQFQVPKKKQQHYCENRISFTYKPFISNPISPNSRCTKPSTMYMHLLSLLSPIIVLTWMELSNLNIDGIK